jgi:uncharacterized short protein YbdD (DUF466 family)
MVLFDPARAPLAAAVRMLLALAAIARLAAQTARLMVGIPDYAAYVEHRRRFHPGAPVMSYEAFFRERQEARYRKGRYGGFC